MRQQRTLRHAIGCAGVGLHSGARVAVTLRPAAEGSGIRFRRVDLPGSPLLVAHPHTAVARAGVANLVGDSGSGVGMVEHLMAALLSCEIDNVLVEISGPELPMMDGSARPLVLLMECAGTVEQPRPAAQLEILRVIEVCSAAGAVRLEPAADLEVVLEGDAAGRVCAFTHRFTPEACKSELVAARDATCRASSAVANGHADESARHAALDALGTLALLPARIIGRYVERNGDAALRLTLLDQLLAEPDRWRLTGSWPDPWRWVASGALAHAS